MVHFVSAGPGNPEFITIRGKSLLEKADVIIYAGSLVNPQLLSWAKGNCRIYNSARMSLDDVIEVIDHAEKANLTTVRLHTGDTTLYSTIGEQIEELEKRNISYDVTPGVSAFQAAAASLHSELTQPGITQSVILTRASGRTKVDQKESIRRFAEHQSTMALYLSSSLAAETRDELLAGGYHGTTPVAVVYKASWPEEKIIHSSVADFPEQMAKAGIKKTAVILVGEVLADRSEIQRKNAGIHENSKLYDPEFTTGYREAKHRTIWMCACTMHAVEQMRQLAAMWSEADPNVVFETHIKCSAHPDNEDHSIRSLTENAFDRVEVMIFFSAAGIAVRSISPFVKSKVTDPAVLVVDEAGRYCIPILSGHLGGANHYASEISKMLQTEAVITTATDLEQKFSVDLFAAKNRLFITDMKKAQDISARIVAGEVLKMYAGRVIAGTVPDGIILTDSIENADIVVKPLREACESSERPFNNEICPENALVLEDGMIDLGIGCRRGTGDAQILSAIDDVLYRFGCSRNRIAGIGSIDLKNSETGLLKVMNMFHVKHKFFTAEELNAVDGTFSSSEFVRNTAGVDCVCERAAAALSGGQLIAKKYAKNGVTVAAAVTYQPLSF